MITTIPRPVIAQIPYNQWRCRLDFGGQRFVDYGPTPDAAYERWRKTTALRLERMGFENPAALIPERLS